MAALQVLQRGVCDQGAVVQLDHLQAVVSTGTAAQVSDAVIGDQLTVRQTLQEDRHGSSITHQNKKELRATHQGLDAVLGDLVTPGDVELLQQRTTLTEPRSFRKDE
ncbi:hypothetical protein EYF80_003813 [Liparis tanakae]|uniref:Uncharacterized protein n=1 Tax=Liparis tanakae TaxID=230148 RepID=A0A4Z2J701_9TELE|nr:hypothetical protein EYF80_003813 [Liparis tanakae]